MLTHAQIEAAMVVTDADTPKMFRVYDASNDLAREGISDPFAFGDGTILFVGIAPEHAPDGAELADCDCGMEHVYYTSIRADGMASIPLFSGTLLEAMIAPATWDEATPLDDQTLFDVQL